MARALTLITTFKAARHNRTANPPGQIEQTVSNIRKESAIGEANQLQHIVKGLMPQSVTPLKLFLLLPQWPALRRTMCMLSGWCEKKSAIRQFSWMWFLGFGFSACTMSGNLMPSRTKKTCYSTHQEYQH